MSMPTIPDINPDINIDREDAINIIVASIAMEELALAHILNAEGEKLQYVLGTLQGKDPGEITICDIMAVNKSIHKTLGDVIKAEMLLQFKLEDAIELDRVSEKCTITIRGRKTWRDGNNVYKTRPSSVKIDLLQDGTVYKSIDVDSAGNGAYAFTGLPIYRSDGTRYSYTVDEINVPVGYTKRVDGYNVINTAEPGTITINGTKTWVDNGNIGAKRPTEITVNLLQNDIQLTPKVVPSPATGVNVSNFSFDNVARFDNEGTPFVYSVKENPVAGYVGSIKGYDITNTLG